MSEDQTQRGDHEAKPSKKLGSEDKKIQMIGMQRDGCVGTHSHHTLPLCSRFKLRWNCAAAEAAAAALAMAAPIPI
jgi:hypothetical protein